MLPREITATCCIYKYTAGKMQGLFNVTADGTCSYIPALNSLYRDMYTHCQVTAVAREQLCGHVSPATREHTIMEETFSVQHVPGLYNKDWLPL
jgi:hypothetical protein